MPIRTHRAEWSIADVPAYVLSCVTAITLLVCSSTAVLSADSASARHPGSPASRVSSHSGSVQVPFDLFGNNILVPVRINGSAPIWCVFDSGASVNLINASLTKRLGLTPQDGSTLNAVGGTVRVSFVQGATLRLGGVTVGSQTLAVAPLDDLAAYSGRDVQGLIGNNFIQNFVVEIDYAHHRLTFRDPQTYTLAGNPDALPLEERGGNPFVKAELSLTGRDTISDWFLLDTGSNGIFSINRPFADRHRLLQTIPKEKQAEGAGGAGVGGESRSTDACIHSIRLGRYTLPDPVISISQDTAGTGATADGGYIGTDLLRRFTVTLDYRAHRMLLTPNAHFREPFEVDLSGLELVTAAQDYRVVKVKRVRPGFPAAKAGLREGDILTAVDGRPTTGADLDRLAKMFRQAGNEYRITVRRGDKELSPRLKMQRRL